MGNGNVFWRKSSKKCCSNILKFLDHEIDKFKKKLQRMIASKLKSRGSNLRSFSFEISDEIENHLVTKYSPGNSTSFILNEIRINPIDKSKFWFTRVFLLYEKNTLKQRCSTYLHYSRV